MSVSDIILSLSKGIDDYTKNQQDRSNETFKSQLDTQKELTVNDAKQKAEAVKTQANNAAKAKLAGQVTPAMLGGMFSQFSPELGAAATKFGQDFKTQNNRDLTTADLKDGLGGILEKIGASQGGDDSKSNKEQEKLQQNYTALKTKVLSNRSGGLGLQDAKVNQAIDLRNAINQYYDLKTDTYNIPPSMHEELALGTARLLSPSGTVAEGMVNALKQGTAREKLANAAIYLGMDPAKVGGPTQDVARMFVDTIDRQGTIAEGLRNHYQEGLKGLADPRLHADRKKQVDDADLTNSFTKELMKAPDHQKHVQAALDNHPAGKVQVIDKNGKKYNLPANQLQDALDQGYTQAE